MNYHSDFILADKLECLFYKYYGVNEANVKSYIRREIEDIVNDQEKQEEHIIIREEEMNNMELQDAIDTLTAFLQDKQEYYKEERDILLSLLKIQLKRASRCTVDYKTREEWNISQTNDKRQEINNKMQGYYNKGNNKWMS